MQEDWQNHKINFKNYILTQNQSFESYFKQIQEANCMGEFFSGEPIIIMNKTGFSHVILIPQGDSEKSCIPVKMLGVEDISTVNRPNYGGLQLEGVITRIQKRDRVELGEEFFSFFSSFFGRYRESNSPANNLKISQGEINDLKLLRGINLNEKPRPNYEGARDYEIQVKHNFEEKNNYRLNVAVPIHNIFRKMVPDVSGVITRMSEISPLVGKLNDKFKFRHDSLVPFHVENFITSDPAVLNQKLFDAYCLFDPQ